MASQRAAGRERHERRRPAGRALPGDGPDGHEGRAVASPAAAMTSAAAHPGPVKVDAVEGRQHASGIPGGCPFTCVG